MRTRAGETERRAEAADADADADEDDADETEAMRAKRDGMREREEDGGSDDCLLYTSPSPRDQRGSRMPSSA